MDVEALLELFAEDAVFESISGTEGVTRTTSREQLRELAVASRSYFEQRRQKPVFWIVDGAHVAVEIEYWCRLAKGLPGKKKAGEELSFRGASFFTIEDGRIARLVDYM
jgi:ketosteroid isomerase-like protein